MNTDKDTYIRLDTMSTITVSGLDASAFLQGQLTSDITQLTETNFTRSMHCNLKGRIASLFNIIKTQYGYILVLPTTLKTITLQALKHYAIFSKVTIEDSSDSHAIIGTSSYAIHQHFFPIDSENYQITPNGYVLAYSPSLCLFIIPRDKTTALIDELAILTPMLTNGNLPHWLAQCIKSKIIELEEHTSGMFLPHRLDLHKTSAISFTKGCYTGQEIIARIHYKSQIKHTLIAFKIASTHTLTPLQTLQQSAQDAIEIVNCLEIENGVYLVLGSLATSADRSGEFTHTNKNGVSESVSIDLLE